MEALALRRKLRRLIDQIVLEDERQLTDEDALAIGSSMFSEEDLADRLDSAAQYVTARVRAIHLPDLTAQIKPREMSSSNVLRVIDAGVTYQSILAVRRTYKGYRRLLAANRGATDRFPVYCFEDGELNVYGSSGVLDQADVMVIKYPTTEEAQFTFYADSFGNTLTVIDGVLPDADFDAKIEYDDKEYNIKIISIEGDVVTTDHQFPFKKGTIKANISGTIYMKRRAVSYLPDRLEEPVLSRAAQLCFMTMGESGLSDIAGHRVQTSLGQIALRIGKVESEAARV